MCCIFEKEIASIFNFMKTNYSNNKLTLKINIMKTFNLNLSTLNIMKTFNLNIMKSAVLILVAILTLSSCSDDNDDIINEQTIEAQESVVKLSENTYEVTFDILEEVDGVELNLSYFVVGENSGKVSSDFLDVANVYYNSSKINNKYIRTSENQIKIIVEINESYQGNVDAFYCFIRKPFINTGDYNNTFKILLN